MKRSIIVVAVWLLVAGCMGTEGTKRKEYVWPESKNKAVRIHPPREEPVTMEPFRPESDLLQRTEELIGATEFHYTGKYCDQCHEKTPVKGGNIYLKYDGDYNLLCKCHLKTPNSYIHPTNIVPSDKKKTKIPADLPLEKGKVTCLTCHDIYRQCQERSAEKYSLRGMPYRKTTDFCFKCHDESSYQMLNPHKQLDEHGNIIVDKCLYCHTEVLDVKKEHHEDPKLIGNLGPLCQRCHIRLAMRGGGFNHLAKPTPEIMAKIKQTEERFGAVLPLDEDGKTTCATCHNPHEKGVIPEGMPAARGAGSLHRLRLPPPMCQWCHQVPITIKK